MFRKLRTILFIPASFFLWFLYAYYTLDRSTGEPLPSLSAAILFIILISIYLSIILRSFKITKKLFFILKARARWFFYFFIASTTLILILETVPFFKNFVHTFEFNPAFELFAFLLLASWSISFILSLSFGIKTFFIKTLPPKKENLITSRRLRFVGMFLLGSIALLVLIGFLFSVERSSNNAEYQAILQEFKEIREYVTTEAVKHKSCFVDNELSDEVKKANACISGIKGIIAKADSEATSVDRMRKYYESNKNTFESEEKALIENSLKVYNSSEYKTLINIQSVYFNAIIEYYEFLKDRVGNKTLDELPQVEQDNLVSISGRMEKLGKELESAKAFFDNYLNQNYSQEFIELFYLKNPQW